MGGGAAGLKAALTAADRGVQVILAVDYPYSGSTFYANSPEWGLTCARDEADVEALYQDIIPVSYTHLRKRCSGTGSRSWNPA